MRKADLARLLEVSNQQAANYLSGRNQPKIESLITLGKHFDIAIDDLILIDLSKGEGRKFGEGAADEGKDVDEQTRELNKLLRLRLQRVEEALKERDPELAKSLGID